MSNVFSQESAGIAEPERPGVAPPSGDRSRWRRIAVRSGKVALAIAAAYYALCLVLLVVYRFAAPPITGLQLQRRMRSWVARRPYHVEKTFVPYSRISGHAARAVIAAEDGRFWRHWGFDFEEMRDAAMDIFDGELPRGASTITQQLMKNLFGGAGRNPVRKFYDVTLTPPAELILGKTRILELYLNNVEWGPGVFGVEAAARHHYGTSRAGSVTGSVRWTGRTAAESAATHAGKHASVPCGDPPTHVGSRLVSGQLPQKVQATEPLKGGTLGKRRAKRAEVVAPKTAKDV